MAQCLIMHYYKDTLNVYSVGFHCSYYKNTKQIYNQAYNILATQQKTLSQNVEIWKEEENKGNKKNKIQFFSSSPIET